MKRRYVVVDLETTGNSPKKGDKIIQFAAVVIEDGEIIERFATFVNPKRGIPEFIVQFTGISDEVVANAPDFGLIAPEVENLLKGSYFVAHNVPFDYSFLEEEMANCGYQIPTLQTIDTVELSRIMLPWADSYRLGQLAENFSIVHEHPHQADSDAEVTAELFLEVMNKLEKLPLVTLYRLLNLSKYLKSDLQEILQEMIDNKSEHISNIEDNQYDIYRGLALKKSEVKQNKEQLFKDINFSDVYKHIQLRDGQEEMANFILDAFQTNQFALVEAGTGIGKTLAYLLPAIYFSKNGHRVLISTYTVQLQQQLIEKEIPKIKINIPFPFQIAVLKGKNHYLSLRKFENALYENNDNYDETLAKAQILVWLTETETGDIDEIKLPTGGKMLWDRINCSNYDTSYLEDPWATRCFYRKATRKAEEAYIIITNHALLFSDIAQQNQLIPNFEYAIIDEIQHFEQAGRKHLGANLNYLQFHFMLSEIGLLENEGLLNKAKQICSKVGLSEEIFLSIDLYIKECKTTISELFRAIRAYVINQTTNNGETEVKIKYKLDLQKEKGPIWSEILELLSRLRIIKKELQLQIERLESLFLNYEKMTTTLNVGTFHDLVSKLQSLFNKIDTLCGFLLEQNKEMVSWIEVDYKGPINEAKLYSEPIEIADFLADKFFAKKRSVALTSATITINNSFDYMIEKIGLKDLYPITKLIASPFDYKRQAVMMIPSDMPFIHAVSLEEYSSHLANQIAQIAQKTNGRMLVLFTSYEMLRTTYQYLKEVTILDDFVLIAQSINGGNRSKLTKHFISANKSILLGTNSFWEGIDIPGDDLSVVILTRLPFANPDDPILVEKYKRINEVGGDAFKNISLPEAIMRFKQGFGRLIRTENDKGVVFVMDRRISTTTYGHQFKTSIPDITIVEDVLPVLIEKIDDWI